MKRFAGGALIVAGLIAGAAVLVVYWPAPPAPVSSPAATPAPAPPPSSAAAPGATRPSNEPSPVPAAPPAAPPVETHAPAPAPRATPTAVSPPASPPPPPDPRPAPTVPALPTSPAVGVPLPGIRPTLEPPAAAVPARSAKEETPAARPDGSEEINALLQVYEESSDKLDVDAAAALWRRPDKRELTRAFSSLSSQDITFDNCFLALADTRATANCHGAVTFVPRVGAPTSRTRKLTWVIELTRTGGRWLIEKVTASESK